MTPIDQQSTALLYGFWARTSGAAGNKKRLRIIGKIKHSKNANDLMEGKKNQSPIGLVSSNFYPGGRVSTMYMATLSQCMPACWTARIRKTS